MRNLIKRLSKSRYNYRPLIEIDLNRSHILGNLHAYEKAHPRLSIAPVLKSNAYGHGLIEIASILKDEGRIPFFVIDTYFEAIQIRNAGIKRPLLVLGYTPIETIIHSNLKNISFMIGDVSLLKDLYSRAKNKANIHIKIDTGMHRQGINVDEITTVFDIIKTKQNILIEGICSHLSDADNSNETFSKSQIILWNKLVARFKDQIPTLRYIHLSSTAGHRFSQEIDANVSRLGIGLYGLDRQNSLPGLDLRPVLSMKTVISTIRKIKKGDSLGYSNTFTAPNDMIIATIPVGYYEGLDRRLSNIGYVSVNNVPCQILGRISMNISIIDVSKIDQAKVGDEVCMISDRSSDKNSIDSMAKLAQTIPYEIAVHIPAHLKRMVV